MSLDEDIFTVAAAIYDADTGGDFRAWLNNYGQDNSVSQRYWKLASAAMDADSRFPGGSREARALRWKAKTLGRQLGRAGERIHQLRCELAASRQGRNLPVGSYYAALERMRAAEVEAEQLRSRIKDLENEDADARDARNLLKDSIQIQDYHDSLYQDTPPPVDVTVDGGSTTPQ